MSQSNLLIVARAGLLTILILTGCDGDGSSGPTAPSGPLVIQSSSTATQPGLGANRVQVRFTVVSGLGELSQASQTGAARAEVCLSGTCTEGTLTTTFAEGMCATVPTMPAGDTGLGLATAWLNGDDVGIDFCVEDMSRQRVFEITVLDGLRRSNTIQTVCSQGTCLSS